MGSSVKETLAPRRIEVTALGNGDGVVDPYKRPVTYDDGTAGYFHDMDFGDKTTTGPTDCVRLTITENGQKKTKTVSFDTLLGPKYDHLGSVEFRKNLIYGQGKRSFTTRSGRNTFKVNWRFASGATKRFHDLVKMNKKREKMLAQPSTSKAKSASELASKAHSRANLLTLGVDLSKIADK